MSKIHQSGLGQRPKKEGRGEGGGGGEGVRGYVPVIILHNNRKNNEATL